MDDTDGSKVFEALVQTITWELDAQMAIRRELEYVPELLADSILDFFHVQLLPGAEAPSVESHLQHYGVRLKPTAPRVLRDSFRKPRRRGLRRLLGRS